MKQKAETKEERKKELEKKRPGIEKVEESVEAVEEGEEIEEMEEIEGALIKGECPECGAQNPEGSKFCLECGEKLD